jgi:4-hydroxy-tetrahydrodipicolinate synthase
MAKAALAELGIIPHATVRLPLLEASPSDRARLTDALTACTATARGCAGRDRGGPSAA